MKYLIGFVFLVVSLAFLAGTGRTIFLAFTDNWTWVLIALPLLAGTILSGLIASVGLTAPREYVDTTGQ